MQGILGHPLSQRLYSPRGARMTHSPRTSYITLWDSCVRVYTYLLPICHEMAMRFQYSDIKLQDKNPVRAVCVVILTCHGAAYRPPPR